MIYFVEISDNRNLLLLNRLKEKHNATAFNFGESCAADSENTLIIFSPARKLSLEEAAQLPERSNIAGGKQREEITEVLNGRSITYHNLLDSESYAVKNAKLTAEATLALLISSTEKSIFENNVLILGLGRVGKAAALLLQKTGVKTDAAASDKAELDASSLYVGNAFALNELPRRINGYDVIINTVPAKILEKESLEKIQAGAALIELASQSCLCDGLAEKYPFTYISAPSLPTKYSALSAADILLECVYEIN